MNINEQNEMNNGLPPSKFSHQAYVNSAERLKLPDIEFRKRTGSYEVDQSSIQKIQKIQMKVKNTLISKRKPSMQLPSPSGVSSSLRSNNNLK